MYIFNKPWWEGRAGLAQQYCVGGDILGESSRGGSPSNNFGAGVGESLGE